MQVINHIGYWGIYMDTLYLSDTMENLKLRSSSIYLIDDQCITELRSGDCIVSQHSAGPQVLFLSGDKRVTLNEDYKMLQLLLKSVVLSLTPIVVDIVSEVISSTLSEATAVVHNLLGSTTEPEKLTVRSNTPKKSDTTKLTQYMYDFIIYAHTDWKNFNRQNPKNKKTMEELIEAINTYMGTDKSRTTLGRIWNGRIDRDNLPVGTAYFDYPYKSKDLS
jgi:hypothetical protein